MKEIKLQFEGRHPRIFVDGVELKYVRQFEISGSVEEVPLMKIEQFIVDDEPKKKPIKG